MLHPVSAQHILTDCPPWTIITSKITWLGLVRMPMSLVLGKFPVKMVKCYLRKVIMLSMSTNFKKKSTKIYFICNTCSLCSIVHPSRSHTTWSNFWVDVVNRYWNSSLSSGLFQCSHLNFHRPIMLDGVIRLLFIIYSSHFFKLKSVDSLFWFSNFDLTSTCHFPVFMSMPPGSSLITMLALKHVHKSLTNMLNSSNNQYIPIMDKNAIECFLLTDEDIFHYSCSILWIFQGRISILLAAAITTDL